MRYILALFWWCTFRLMWVTLSVKVQAIDESGNVRRGWGSPKRDARSRFGMFVLYWDPSSSDGDWMSGMCVPVAEENVCWCRGWKKESVKALLAARALT